MDQDHHWMLPYISSWINNIYVIIIISPLYCQINNAICSSIVVLFFFLGVSEMVITNIITLNVYIGSSIASLKKLLMFLHMWKHTRYLQFADARMATQLMSETLKVDFELSLSLSSIDLCVRWTHLLMMLKCHINRFTLLANYTYRYSIHLVWTWYFEYCCLFL